MEDVVVHPECPFSVKTFDLLEKLHKNSNKNFYIEQKKQFNTYVEIPLQILCCQVGLKLIKNKITNYIEFDFINLPNKFEDKSFVYILKPKITNNKSTGTNFFITLEASDFRFGLLIHHRSLDKQNFIHNLKKESVKEVILQHTKPLINVNFTHLQRQALIALIFWQIGSGFWLDRIVPLKIFKPAHIYNPAKSYSARMNS
jgi:hypothetical protein